MATTETTQAADTPKKTVQAADKPEKAAQTAPDRRPGNGGKKRRRHYPTAASRLVILAVVLVGVGAMLATLLKTVSSGQEELRSARTTPRPAVTATPEPSPEPSPKPTPGLPEVDLDGWQLRLVRRGSPLEEDFAPPELTDVGDGQTMDSRVAPALKSLIEDAKQAGNSVYVCSGFRDYDTQSVIYWRHIDQYTAEGMTEEEADAKTRLAVNYPGESEHQSGLAVDILEYNGQPMEPYICSEKLMVWLQANCAEYGFVIRYPDGKTDVTGVEYEPWHLRYVGRDAAEYIMEHGLCLEEFLELYEEEQ